MSRETFKPLPHQDLMTRWLLNRKESALFCDPGLGKTASSLRAFDRLSIDGISKGMLVIAPLRVIGITWPSEVGKWDFARHMTITNMRTAEGVKHWQKKTADIYTINSELLATREVKKKCPDCYDGEKAKREHCITCEGEGTITAEYPGFVAKFLKGMKKEDLPVDTLLIDESSLCKNHKSKRFNALRVYRELFDRIYIMTGTPAPNSYIDLWAQLRFLDNGQRLGVSITRYREAYFAKTGGPFGKYVLKSGAKEAIDKKISDIALALSSEDYLDVPTCAFTDIEVTLNPKARAEYKTMKKELLLQIESGEIEALNAAALTNKLLQITGGAVYDADRTVHVLHDAKVKALQALVKRHKGEPILVLTQFKHERARLLEAIPEARMFHEKGMADWKAGKIPVWIADPRSMSHGIDGMQHGGRIAVWFTLSYSNETYIQTNARLVRTGQAHETIIYRLIATDTIDEAVAECIREKGDQQRGLFAALKNLQLMEKTSKMKKA